MSDIFIAAGIRVDRQEVAEQLRWTAHTQAWHGEVGSLTWLVTRVDDPVLWSPAWDPISRTWVLVAGRFAFEESEWQQAERLPYQGGLAARLILNRWLSGDARVIEQLNGAGLAVIIDERSGVLHLWTDRMGFYPAYLWTGSGFVVSSHPDVAANVLEKTGHPCNFDAITMAEFLRTGTATQPHTYWRGIEQLDAGTRYRFSWKGEHRLKESSQYWRPAYFDEPYLEDRGEIVDQLTDALRSAVRKRTLPRLGRVALLLSAGADSRAVLFGASDPSKVTCFTFFDEPNQELRSAQALAAAAGATHIAYQRSKDYYFEHAEAAVRISGGMWSLESAHHTGLLPQLSASSFDTVLTGCYADYLLKGIVYNRRPRTLYNRALPIYEFSSFEYRWHHPYCSLPPNWNDQVDFRLKTRLSAGMLGNVDRRSEIEYLRLAPIIREPDASGRLWLRRCTGLDVFMSDSHVLSLFGKMSPKEKLNGVPFGMAVSRIVGDAGRKILNNNYSAPVGASELQRVVAFVRASLMRKVTGQGGGQPYEHDSTSVATVGSWPYLPRVIKMSERVRDWYASQSAEQRDFLFDILGAERKKWSIDDWAEHDPTLFMRLYTSSLWLEQQPQALSRIEMAA